MSKARRPLSAILNLKKMPRPGPRPYECVRRAWHSERHQPLRGSIIQQIFKFVHGNHNSSTKNNREWQDKLPLLVFKTEEIIYSKANSEADYLDGQTLWERINDAVNTIIRRDQTSETGHLLPPCVEAALNLGCVPVRASRSQGNSNPRNYLSSIIHEEEQQQQLKHPLETPSTSKQLNQNNGDIEETGGFGCDLTLRLGSGSSSTSTSTGIINLNRVPTEEATIIRWRKRKASVTQEWQITNKFTCQRQDPGS